MTAAPTPLRRDRGLLLLLVLFLLGLPLVTTRIYASDEIKYFAYLHSLSFDHDLNFANDYQHWVDEATKQGDQQKAATLRTLLKPNPATGLPINEAPIGTAILWAPAFGLAHLGVLAARAFGARVAADGYSQPYISAICYASYLYGCAGLLLIYALLRRYFTQFAAALAVLAVWLGTSAFFYMIIAPPWSHAVSLFTVALFTTVWMRTRPLERRLPRQWALLGFCAGLMMLVREQDALFLALPAVETLAWLWTHRADWRPARPAPAALGFAAPAAPPITRPIAPPSTMGSTVRRLVTGWALLLVVAAVTFIPQLITYKVLGGRFAPSSTVGEKLNFLAPHALEVLFSPPYGLIPWAPVVLPALLGLLALARWDRLLAGAAAVAVAAQVWAAGSYSTWMGASSFGQRRFVNCTVLFAFGLAAGIAWLVDHGVPRPVLVVLALLFVGWEGGLALQYAVWSSKERQLGLQWPAVLQGEYVAYRRIPELIGRFLFNRASFYRNTAP